MATSSPSIDELAAQFGRMPGIGRRTAERLAYHVQRLSTAEAQQLVEAIRAVKARARICSLCHNVSESDPCPICRSRSRDGSVVCVVEDARDLAVFEESGGYRGLYHVLGGRIAPLEGVHPEDLNIESLVKRVREGKVREVILATNPTTEGDSTASFLIDKLAPLGVTVSVLARGMPAGGRLEHAARGTLFGALQGRRPVRAKGE
jgi:recombination protein RecR